MTVESGPTTAELQARIDELLEQIDQLELQLAQIGRAMKFSEGIGWDAGIQAGIEALTALPKKGSIGGAG